MNWKMVLIIALVVGVLMMGVVTVVDLRLSTAELKKLDQLEPETRRLVVRLLERMQSRHGLRVLVGSTRRTADEQRALVAAGKSTNNLGWHNLGRAVDLYPYDPETGKPDMAGKKVELYRKLHQESAALGFRNLAFNADGTKKYLNTNKGPVWDAGHVEYHGPHQTLAIALRSEPIEVA